VEKEEIKTGGPVKIIWDDAEIRSSYPDIAQVKASRNEVMLLFGDTDATHPGRDVLHAKLSDQIVFNPFVAKRFAIQLIEGIRNYEAKFGPIGGKNIIHRRLEPTPPLSPPPFKSAKGSQSVDLVFEFLNEQNIRPAFERSFKIMDNTLFENRFLLGFEKDTIRSNPDEKISEICRKLGMPENFHEKLRNNLPESNIVGFGFGEDERGCVVRAYLEFGGRFFRAVRSNPLNPEPYLSHLGFKWDAADNTRKALTIYTCHPRYTYEEMIKRLANDFYKNKVFSPFEIIKKILYAASKKAGSNGFLFLDVNEKDNQRMSFDINLYVANLRLKELHPLLSDIFEHYGLDQERFQNWFTHVKEDILGHLAGGTGGDGRDFLTIYSGE